MHVTCYYRVYSTQELRVIFDMKHMAASVFILGIWLSQVDLRCEIGLGGATTNSREPYL